MSAKTLYIQSDLILIYDLKHAAPYTAYSLYWLILQVVHQKKLTVSDGTNQKPTPNIIENGRGNTKAWLEITEI